MRFLLWKKVLCLSLFLFWFDCKSGAAFQKYISEILLRRADGSFPPTDAFHTSNVKKACTERKLSVSNDSFEEEDLPNTNSRLPEYCWFAMTILLCLLLAVSSTTACLSAERGSYSFLLQPQPFFFLQMINLSLLSLLSCSYQFFLSIRLIFCHFWTRAWNVVGVIGTHCGLLSSQFL